MTKVVLEKLGRFPERWRAMSRRRRWMWSYLAAIVMSLLWIETVGLSQIRLDLDLHPTRFWQLYPHRFSEINPDRYRGERVDFSKPKPGLRVLCLGDSSTFGLGLPVKDTYPFQLQHLLRKRAVDAQVVNLGVPGYTVVQIRDWLHYWLEERGVRADAAVFYTGHNEWKGSHTGYADENRRLGRDTGAPPRWLSYFRTVRMWRYKHAKWVSIRPVRQRQPRVPEQRYVALIENLVTDCRDRGIRPYWLAYRQRDPSAMQLKYMELGRETCERLDVPFLPMETMIANEATAFGEDGTHPFPEGYRLIAEAVAEAVMADFGGESHGPNENGPAEAEPR
ncbi:MAG: SGNH/GDSL hydrolase family protein [Deltaproteobacteria bacterium]|nr:SGNH/GDSL hydrolase family protein [Deltaproteobacteria bacterium]MCB9490106.1 SGNH/GDSL hydrolase family protein [Deltaproteobacteria bacterium]